MPNKKNQILKPSVILLGFIALVTQIVLLREFLTLFNGNELVIGIILANWMLLTGFGAYLGKYSAANDKRAYWIIILLAILAFLPILTVLGLHFLWHNFFPSGIMAGITHVFYYSFLILSPFCIISGILFTLFAKEVSIKAKSNKIGDVYAWESLGSVIGGAIFNFILIWVLSALQSLFLIMILVVIFTISLSIKYKLYIITGTIVIIALFFSFFFLRSDLDHEVRKLAFPGQSISYSKDSPFGVFTITEQKGQINYYENNILISSSGDNVSREESVHLAMIQHSNPKNILVFSGIISGIINEITKYPIEAIDYVDVNPEIIKIAKEKIKIDSLKTLNIIEKDALRFLQKNKRKYDVVMINLPKPSTIQFNRFYTKEFFQLLKKSLSPDAIISLSFPSSGNYLSNEAKRLLSIIYATLNSEFQNVMILPLNKDFLLASDDSLTHEITKKIAEYKISTEYVNSYYLNDDLLHLRSQQITNQLDLNADINKDFSPVFYQSQIELWMSKFNIRYWIPAAIILLFSGFFFVRTGIVYKGVFAAGFAGTSIEIILLLGFQIIFGYVYIVAGFFIMIFMGGLAFGAHYLPKKFKQINKKLFYKLQLVIAAYALFLPLWIYLLKSVLMHDAIIFILFSILLLVISVITGALFSVASYIVKSDYGTVASRTYGLDLLGAATGALLFTIYLIPLFGFGWSIILTGVFNLFIAIATSRK